MDQTTQDELLRIERARERRMKRFDFAAAMGGIFALLILSPFLLIAGILIFS